MSNKSSLRIYCILSTATLMEMVLLLQRGVWSGVDRVPIGTVELIHNIILDPESVEVRVMGGRSIFLEDDFRKEIREMLGESQLGWANTAAELLGRYKEGGVNGDDAHRLESFLQRFKKAIQQATPAASAA